MNILVYGRGWIGEQFINLLQKENINYVEIGAYAGASAILMLHNKNVKVISIDIGHPVNKQKVIENINIF